MFSSKSKNPEQPAAPAATPPQAGVQSGPLKRTIRGSSAPSLICADLVVNGTLTSNGDIQIDGRVEGDVYSSGLVIGENAFINGEVVADDVTVRGRIEGSIRARKVLLAATSHVEGNILHEAFAVEAGAFFEGNCRHSENPLSDEHKSSAAKPTPSHIPASQSTQAAQPAPAKPADLLTPRKPSTPSPAATVAPLKSGG